MNSRDIIRNLWDNQGFGNVAIWEDETMTIVPPGFSGEHAEKKLLCVFKPIPLVAKYPMLDHALGDLELLESIEVTIRNAGGDITRGD
jgi:hypothetical protein